MYLKICSPYHTLYLLFLTLIRTFKFPTNKTSPRVNITIIFTNQPSAKFSKNFDKLIFSADFDHLGVSFDYLQNSNKPTFAKIFITEGLDSLALSQNKSKICMHLCRPKAQHLFHYNQLSKSSQHCLNNFTHNREYGLWII